MRFLLAFLAVSCIVQGEFVLDGIDLGDREFEQCRYCDERSDRAGTRATAAALREFMTRNHMKIVVDKGDVSVSERYPNEGISTGHSCSVTAEARDVVARATMIPGSVELSPEGVVYIDEIQNSIAVADVRHSLSVSLTVRVWLGTRDFRGKCRNIGRKTCSTDGYSEGVNHVSVNLAASNVLVECIAGQEHLTFNIDAKVIDEAKDKTYPTVEVGKKSSCDLKILGIKIGSINSKIQNYATRYMGAGARFYELRGARLVAELERKLGVELGSTVTIPINDAHGNPRTCSRRRRRSSSCVRMTCPQGFTRIGETDKCQKYFGRETPNCSQFGEGATLYTRDITSTIKMHWCHVPRIPA